MRPAGASLAGGRVIRERVRHCARGRSDGILFRHAHAAAAPENP